MKETAARVGLITIAVLAGVLNGSPLAVFVAGMSALILSWLVDYGAREMERGLELASNDRLALLTWQLRTDAAHLALQRRRLADQADRWMSGHQYAPRPHWPTVDPDQVFQGELERAMVPMVVPVPSQPEPVVYRGATVDEFMFADGGLLCVPAALRLHRYADTP